MKITVNIVEAFVQGDYGDVPGLEGQCERCGHSVEVYGDGEASEHALCAKMRDECPNGESNFYIANR